MSHHKKEDMPLKQSAHKDKKIKDKGNVTSAGKATENIEDSEVRENGGGGDNHERDVNTRGMAREHSPDHVYTPQQHGGTAERSADNSLSVEPTNRDIVNMLTLQHTETKSNFVKIFQRLDDYELSLNVAHDNISENKDEIKSLRQENSQIKTSMADLNKSLITMQTQLREVLEKQERTERRSREWGIRIHGVPESPAEDIRSVVANVISRYKLAGLNTPEQVADVIEHCHRLGARPSAGKPRTIIANLFSRPLRNALLKDAKSVNSNKDVAIYFAEDLTKMDHANKMLARDQMRQAYSRGDRVMFKRGQLIINSQVVAITGSATKQDEKTETRGTGTGRS